MASGGATQAVVRKAETGDLTAIIAIAMATGQDEDWHAVYPAYIGHLMTYGSLLIAERSGGVTGFGATLPIGSGAEAISMLTDLFVHPQAHGTGTGRLILGKLWPGDQRRMTFSSLHANALPLYTSFGVDAWWPLLYLRGDVRQLPAPDGWSVALSDPDQVGALELGWTGTDRTRDHRFWAGWPGGGAVVAASKGQPVAAGTIGGAAPEYGICHLSVDPRIGDDQARDAVIAVLSSLSPADGRARICLPGPHPATRALLRAGWRVEEFDLHMTSDPGLIDPRRLVPSPAMA
jgi:GNAT superfamily N-acetyltransferase